jgi:predicted nucleic acid-binding protein
MGLIHLDAGVVIGLLDTTDAHHESATDALAGAIRSGDRMAMAASAFAECLVGPSRRG